MALEDAAPDEHGQGPGRPPACLAGVDPEHARAQPDVGGPGTRVRVHHQLELLGQRPQRLVVGIVVRRTLEPAGGDEDPGVALFLGLADDVSTVSMSGMMAGTTATPMRRCGSWLTKSDSHRLWARLPRPPPASVLSPARPVPNGDGGDPARAEHVGVGEQHLAGHALRVQHALRVAESKAAVRPPSPPVSSSHSAWKSAVGVVPHLRSQIAQLLLEDVEAITEPGIEVLAVDVGGWSGVPVGRDHQVVRHG